MMGVYNNINKIILFTNQVLSSKYKSNIISLLTLDLPHWCHLNATLSAIIIIIIIVLNTLIRT